MNIIKELKQPILLSLALFLLCGLAYPYALTGVGQVFMPEKAQGSLLRMGDQQDSQVVGSALVGQNFTDPRFLKGRPSAVNYNTFSPQDVDNKSVASGSANLAASNPALIERIAQDKQAFLAAHPDHPDTREIPADLLTASGSGLDPHISPAAASVQLPALVKHTGLPMHELEAIVARNTTGKLLGVLGGESVHVLKVNMEIAHALGMTADK